MELHERHAENARRDGNEGLARHHERAAERAANQGDDKKPKPILLDLDGTGIRLTALNESTQYIDSGNSGLQHRTAWAGVGDGVLFFDPDGHNAILETRQYVFTEWDPGASSDLEALRSAFDSDGDGRLTAADDDWLSFKVMVTRPDGSQMAMTLDDLDIAAIDLTGDAVFIELPDGSMITGQSSFTRDDGSTGTVADATLVSDADGYRVEEALSTDGSGNAVREVTAFATDGSIDHITTSVSAPDGSAVTNSYDTDGDGVVDQVQVILTSVSPSGETVRDVTNYLGASAATGVLHDRTVTTWSSDWSTETIERDSLGGGWFDERETRVENTDGSQSVQIEALGPDGSVIRSETRSVSSDGMTRQTDWDADGDGVDDTLSTFTISEDAAGVRTETDVVRNADATFRTSETVTISADGRDRVISRDLDGDGTADRVEDRSFSVDAGGTTTTTITVSNADGGLIRREDHVQSSDALDKRVTLDLDGDGDTDRTEIWTTTIDGTGERTTLTRVEHGDGSIAFQEREVLGADKITQTVELDLNQDGVFAASDLVSRVTIEPGTDERVEESWDRSIDGGITGYVRKISSQDGLTQTTLVDLDADAADYATGGIRSHTDSGGTNWLDERIEDQTVINANGSTTRTVETFNGDGSSRSEITYDVSADGLTRTETRDVDGDGMADWVSTQVQSNLAGGAIRTEAVNLAGDGTTVLNSTRVTESADRRIVTHETDSDGDGFHDRVTVDTQGLDGARSSETHLYHGDGSLAAHILSLTSANGLSTSVQEDANADGVFERTESATTVLGSDGARTTTTTVTATDGSLISGSERVVSDDGLTITGSSDLDGDATAERVSTAATGLQSDGDRETTTTTRAADNSVLTVETSTRSDDGLHTVTETDRDGDGTDEIRQESTQVLFGNGDVETTVDVTDLMVSELRSRSFERISDNGRLTENFLDSDGDGNWNETTTRQIHTDGRVTTDTETLNADGTLQSASQVETSATGLSTTTRTDMDGDGVWDSVETETTTLGTDGSTTRSIESRTADGTLITATEVITSDDGLQTISSLDLDGDGVDDFATNSTTTIAANGTQTVAEENTSRDGSRIQEHTTTEFAGGERTEWTIDLDGNGFQDRSGFRDVLDTGIRVEEITYHSSGGTAVAHEEVRVSADGLTTVTSRDRDADGHAEHVITEAEQWNANGDVETTTTIRNGSNVLLGERILTEAADGLFWRSELDRDGDGINDAYADWTMSYEANGDVRTVIRSLDSGFDLQSKIVQVIDGSGLDEAWEMDFDGVGGADRIIAVDRDGTGASTTVHESFAGGGLRNEMVTTTVSADGLTETVEVDFDGDGQTDQVVVTEIDADRRTIVTSSDLDSIGLVASAMTVATAANGTSTVATIDHDGDGVADITRSTVREILSDGSERTVFTEVMGDVTSYESTLLVAGDGLSSTESFDTNGDGSIEGSRHFERDIRDDGSILETTQTVLDDGTLYACQSVEISADARTRISTYDYDGNGIADKITQWRENADGSTTEVSRTYSEAGVLVSEFITEVTADGTYEVQNRNGELLTIERSELEADTFTWSFGELEGSRTTDDLGVREWSYGSDTVRLDAAATARVLEEAAGLYDTILDRDMDFLEEQALVQFVSGGELDRSALTDALLNSGEYAVRFGTEIDGGAGSPGGGEDRVFSVTVGPGGSEDDDQVLQLVESISGKQPPDDSITWTFVEQGSAAYGAATGIERPTDAAFVVQIYLNAFMRAPSMAELLEAVTELATGAVTRTEFVLSIDQSSEHRLTGNGHMLTNNFDVVMNPAQFERFLDVAFVEQQIQDLFDIAYNRAPTEYELEHYSDLLLEGSARLTDIATTLLSLPGAISGTPTNSLNGLPVAEFVEEAFRNATSEFPSAQVFSDWGAAISSGAISAADFIAALAQSIDHDLDGNQTEPPQYETVNTVDGTDAAETLTGTVESDQINGLEGNDLLYGGNGSDVLVGGEGADYLDGGPGNDRYLWSRGDGDDTIYDTDTSETDVDVLELSDVASSEVTLTRSANHIVVDIAGVDGGTLQFTNQFHAPGYGYGIEQIEFSDGVTWTLDEIFAQTLTEGTSLNDTIHGTNRATDNLYGDEGIDTIYAYRGDDHIHGGLGADLLYGGWNANYEEDGNDSYYWSIGDGNDTVFDMARAVSPTEVDRLIFGDVVSGDVALTRSGDNLLIDVAPLGEQIMLLNQFWMLGEREGLGIEIIEFSDGVTWTLEDIFAQTFTHGTSGNDTLYGTNRAGDNLHGYEGDDTLYGYDEDDRLIGGEGADFLDGGNGSDRYIWSRGDGDDNIYDTSTSETEIDVLELTDVASTEVSLWRNDGHMMIDIGGTGGGTLYFTYQFYAPGHGYSIEQIEFSDGVTWTLEDIFAQTDTNGTSGNDTLYGTNRAGDNLYGYAGDDALYGYNEDDRLIGGTGADFLDGGNGSDRYLWSRGDGDDNIYDTSSSLTDVDVLELTDVAHSDATITRSGNHMTIDVDGAGGGTLHLTNQFYSASHGYGIEQIEYSNGVIWRLQADRSTETMTDSADIFDWASYTDTFDLGGNLVGRSRTDDSGRLSDTAYDNGIVLWNLLTDAGDEFDWTTIERSYDANGIITDRINTYDDGRLLETSYLNGVQSTATMTDTADVIHWDNYVDTFDLSGNLVTRLITYDDGTQDLFYY